MAPNIDMGLTQLFQHVDKDLYVNWHAIAAAGSHISRVHLSRSGRRRLDDVLISWYTRDGLPVCHRNDIDPNQAHKRFPRSGDSAVTVRQAADANFQHPWMSAQKVKEHTPAGPVQLLLPAYDVEPDYLLLDGAHRSIATLRAGLGYDIDLAVIHGPIDPCIFGDLVVFS